MKRSITTLAASSIVFGAIALGAAHLAQAQPAKGAPAAFERVREVMSNRLKELKLVGDPDRDFVAVLMAQHEDLVFLAKTQLEYGGDRQLRQLAQKISDDTSKGISELKEWQVRSGQADYKAQPDQPPPGSGPLDRKGQPQATLQPQAPAAAPVSPAAPQAPAGQLPLVSGKVEDIDPAQGKVTIEHNAIPNLNMDGMTMVFRAQNPAMLKSVEKGDKVQFSADRVNGQLTLMKIQKGR